AVRGRAEPDDGRRTQVRRRGGEPDARGGGATVRPTEGCPTGTGQGVRDDRHQDPGEGQRAPGTDGPGRTAGPGPVRRVRAGRGDPARVLRRGGPGTGVRHGAQGPGLGRRSAPALRREYGRLVTLRFGPVPPIRQEPRPAYLEGAVESQAFEPTGRT